MQSAADATVRRGTLLQLTRAGRDSLAQALPVWRAARAGIEAMLAVQGIADPKPALLQLGFNRPPGGE